MRFTHARWPGKPLIALLLLAPFLVTGCATKGSLREAEARMLDRDDELREDLEKLSDEIAALAPRVATVERDIEDLEKLEARLTDFNRRMDGIRQEMTILQGEMEQELRRVDGELTSASANAAEASELGRKMSNSYLKSLRTERSQLRRQLDEVEELLNSWRRLEGDDGFASE